MTSPDEPASAAPLDQALRASEARLRQLVASAQDAVIITDTDGMVVDWNPCAERMFGWSAEEAIGQRLSGLIVPPALRARYEQGLRGYVETRQGWIIGQSVEMDAQARSGHQIPIEMSLWPLETSEQLLFGAFIRDIYSRRQAEAALREQEQKYRLVVDHGSEGILVVREGQIVFANPATERLVGVGFDELQSKPFPNWIHPEDRPLVIDRHLRRLRGETVDPQYSFRLLRADESLLWVELSVVPIDWEGRPATLSFITDITERKRLEDSLRLSLRALERKTTEQEAILQSTLIGISLLSQQRFQWVNRTLADMFGFSPRQMIGQQARLVFGDDDTWEDFVDSCVDNLDRRGSYETERLLVRSDGSPIFVQLQGTRLPGEEGPRSSLWTFLDITERKLAEDKLERNLAREKELNQLKSRFVSMTSHEFRTPLAGILSSVELLRHYGARLPDEEKVELFEQIEASVERMTTMLDNILVIGRADAQGLQFRPEPVDAAALCRELAEEVTRSRSGGEGRPRLAMDIADAEGQTLLLDPTLLRHILGNLLSNAFKYSPSGGQVSFDVGLDEESIRFRVEDQGIGIPREDQAKLFESFHRASNVGNIAGTGLGLSIVKQSVDLHGGRIEIDSEPGRGTCFTVRIPVGNRKAR